MRNHIQTSSSVNKVMGSGSFYIYTGALIILWLILILYAVITQRPFFADGSHFFLSILEKKSIVGDFDFNRHFAHYFTQFPVVFFIKFLDNKNINTLSYMYGLGLFLPQLISLLICYSIARRYNINFMMFPVISLFGLSMNMSFFLISESHVISNIFWPILFYITLRKEYSYIETLCLILLSLVFIRSYESALFLGPMLIIFLLIVMRERWHTSGIRTKIVWILIMALFSISILIASESILFPRYQANRTSFLSSFPHILQHWMALLSLAYMLTISFCILVPNFVKSFYYKVIVATLISLNSFVSLIPFLMPDLIRPYLHYAARSFVSYLLPLISVLAFLVLKGTVIVPNFAWKKISLLVAFLVAGQLTWQILATSQWAGFRQIYKEELAVHSGIVPFEHTLLNKNRIGIQLIKPMTWGWTNPTLSILWSRNGNVCTIINNPIRESRKWQPFDPLKADELPNVKEFGFSFDRYKMMLAQRKQ